MAQFQADRLALERLVKPPELRGVRASARIPNRFQPMSGEYRDGREVDDGRTEFSGLSGARRLPPVPLGFRGPSVVPEELPRVRPAPLPVVPFGAPTGFVRPGMSSLSALPHFAGGGTLGAGGTGVVGENGEEEITALPGGGVNIKPLAPRNFAGGVGTPRADLSGFGGVGLRSQDANDRLRRAGLSGITPRPVSRPSAQPEAAAQSATTAQPAAVPEREISTQPSASAQLTGVDATRPAPEVPKLSGRAGLTLAPRPKTLMPGAPPTASPDMTGLMTEEASLTAPPPAQRSAESRFIGAASQFASEKAPNPNDPRFHVPGWKRGIAAALGIAAGAFGENPRAVVPIYRAVTGAPYERAMQQYYQNRLAQTQALPQLKAAAAQEATENAQDENAYERQQTAIENDLKNRNAQATQEQRNDELANASASKTPKGRAAYMAANPQLFEGMSDADKRNYVLTGASPKAEIPELVAGSIGGKPVYALYDRKKGFLDPTTHQPLTGFAPAAADENTRLSGMGAYTLSRILQEETSDNPAIRALLPSLLEKLGIPLTPDQKNALERVPEGQPRDASGTPIGTRMPGAPTASTRSRGQFAQAAVDQIGRIRSEIGDLKGQLGPLQGRWNDFFTGKLGADNPEYYGLYTDLHNLATAWMRLHANSDNARQEFEEILSGAHSPADLLSALQRIQDQADDYIRIGSGRASIGPPSGMPDGSIKMKSPTGEVRWVAPDSVSAMKAKGAEEVK